jgi:hypothetical protein
MLWDVAVASDERLMLAFKLTKQTLIVVPVNSSATFQPPVTAVSTRARVAF